MAKGFGIAALVLAILSTFAAYGFNFGAIWLSMIACTVAVWNGDRAFTIASVVIAGAGLLLFSPLTMAVIAVNASGRGDYSAAIMAFLPFAFPILAGLWLLRQHTVALQNSGNRSTTD